MPFGLGSTIDAFRKLAPVPLLALGLGSVAVLNAPDSVAGSTGITEFRETWRGYIGLVAFVAWSYLAAHLISWVVGLVVSCLKNRSIKRNQIDLLKALAPHERWYLKAFVCDEVTTIRCGMDDGIIGGLDAKGMVFRSSAVGDCVDGFPWNIQPWALEYLKKNPKLLEGAVEPHSPSPLQTRLDF